MELVIKYKFYNIFFITEVNYDTELFSLNWVQMLSKIIVWVLYGWIHNMWCVIFYISPHFNNTMNITTIS